MKELFQIIERCLVIGTREYFIQFYMFSAQNRRNFWCSEALFQTSIWRLNVLLFYFFIYKFNYHFILLWLYCVDFKASILGKGDQCSAASALFSDPYSFASFNFFLSLTRKWVVKDWKLQHKHYQGSGREWERGWGCSFFNEVDSTLRFEICFFNTLIDLLFLGSGAVAVAAEVRLLLKIWESRK